MVDVAFHTGIPFPIDYACRLLRKAYRSGARVAVHGEPALLDKLDQALWIFEQLEFVPHVLLPRDAANAQRLARTPIVLVKGDARAPDTCRIGVSLGGHPVAAEDFDRVIAIIGDEPAHREAGRLRWREYQRDGHAVTNVSKPAGSEA
jgi:DNA polymerase-3 subunit chi